MKMNQKLVTNILAIALTVIGMTGCSKDDNGEIVETYSGKYELAEATLKTVDIGIKMEVNEDITPIIQEALLAVSPCDDPARTLIELSDDGSIRLECKEGGTSILAGNWTENTKKRELSLTFQEASLWQGEAITLVNVKVDGMQVSGESEPLSVEKKWLVDFIDIPAQVPDVIEVTFALEMVRQ